MIPKLPGIAGLGKFSLGVLSGAVTGGAPLVATALEGILEENVGEGFGGGGAGARNGLTPAVEVLATQPLLRPRGVIIPSGITPTPVTPEILKRYRRPIQRLTRMPTDTITPKGVTISGIKPMVLTAVEKAALLARYQR